MEARPVVSRMSPDGGQFQPDPTSPAPTFNATLVDPGRARLVQNATFTRILQGLLAAMILCAIIAFLNDTRRVLPKNPCSIAAVASLLAGSELLSEKAITPGSEWCSDKELGDVPFRGWLSSTGWWAHGDGGARFGNHVGKHPAQRMEDVGRDLSTGRGASVASKPPLPPVDEDVGEAFLKRDALYETVRMTHARRGLEV